MDTIYSAGEIVTRCIEEGIRVDVPVVYYALLFHDAGYHENHKALGFETKESYSATLAKRHLTANNVAAKLVDKVEAAILSTHRDASFLSTEQKAVRAADLSGLAASYDVFLVNTVNLKIEHELLNDTSLDWETWKTQVSKTIEFYLSQQIRLTSYFMDENGNSAFHTAVRENLNRLKEEQSPHV